MKKYLMTLLCIAVLSGCNVDEVVAINDNMEEETVWVFAQFNVPEEGDKIDSFYYYGKVSKPLYERIKSNNIQQGFILLDDVKYWGTDDLIHDYADEEEEGELVFRIENIYRIKLIKKEPKLGKAPFSENTELESPASLPTT